MAPDGIEQVVATDHGRRLLDQMTEHGKGLRTQVDRSIRSGDRLLLGIDFELVELNDQDELPSPALLPAPARKYFKKRMQPWAN